MNQTAMDEISDAINAHEESVVGELVEALKRVGSCCGCMDKEAQELIDRIEGKR